MKITGLDLSFTSTGAARLVVGSSRPPVVDRLQPPKALGTGHPRLQWLIQECASWTTGSDLVVIEGPAYDRHQGQHKIGGLWWMVAHWLWKHRIPYIEIPPSCVKKYATGAGNADKDRVLAAVIRRYKDVEVTGNDEADALVLACMAADHYGCPVAEVPDAHRAALRSIKVWPDIAEVVPHAS